MMGLTSRKEGDEKSSNSELEDESSEDGGRDNDDLYPSDTFNLVS